MNFDISHIYELGVKVTFTLTPQNFFWTFFATAFKTCFTTAKITFTSIKDLISFLSWI